MTATQPIETRVIPTAHAHAYNPSISDFGGAEWMAYRWHPKPDHWRTEMVIVKDGVEKPLLPPEQYAKHSIEDGRFHTFQGKLYLSVTVARSRVSGQGVDPCVSLYGELSETETGWILKNPIEPKHPNNVWSKQTKNIVYFEL